MKSRIPVEIPKTVRRGNRRRVLIAASALTLIVALYLAVSYFVLSASLAPAPRCPDRTPADSGVAAEAVRFRSDVDEVSLSGWFLPSRGRRAIILIQGLNDQGWNSSHSDIAAAYVGAGFDVLVFDLRGHGSSSGDRLGLGWHERRDVRAAVNLLLDRGFIPGAIGIHGGSYGAAVALLSAAAIPEIGAVVAGSAFADIRDVMDTQIEDKTGVPSWLSRHFLRPGLAFVALHLYGLDFDVIPPERAVPVIAPRPILFIHGSEDRVIPVEHAYRLRAASKNPSDELWVLPLPGHTPGVRLPGEACETLEVSPLRETYLRKVVAFFDGSLPPSTLIPGE